MATLGDGRVDLKGCYGLSLQFCNESKRFEHIVFPSLVGDDCRSGQGGLTVSFKEENGWH
jgi:hypothetical protein